MDNEPCGKVLLWGTKLGETFYSSIWERGWEESASYDTRVGVANGSGDQ